MRGATCASASGCSQGPSRCRALRAGRGACWSGVTAIYGAAPETFDDALAIRVPRRGSGGPARSTVAAVYGRRARRPGRAVPTAAVRELVGHAAAGRSSGRSGANRRDDGLYHGYNLLHVEAGRASVDPPLPDARGPGRRARRPGCWRRPRRSAVLRALRASELYRADQNSYLLYPDRDLPSVPERNTIAGAAAARRPAALRRATPAAAGTSRPTCETPHDVAARLDAMDVDAAASATAASWTSGSRPSTTASSRAAAAPSSCSKAWAASTGTWSPSCCWRSRSATRRAEPSRRGRRGRSGAGRRLRRHPRRPRLPQAGRGPRRLPDRSVLAHAAAPRRPAAGHDRPGQGGDPDPLGRARRAGSAEAGCGSRQGCCTGPSSRQRRTCSTTSTSLARIGRGSCPRAAWPSRSAVLRSATSWPTGPPSSWIV